MSTVASLLEVLEAIYECEDNSLLQSSLAHVQHELYFQPRNIIEKIASRFDVADCLAQVMRRCQDSNSALVCLAGQALHLFAANAPTVVSSLVESRTADFLWLLIVQHQDNVSVVQTCVTVISDILAHETLEPPPADGLTCVIKLMGTTAEDPKLLLPCCRLLESAAQQDEPAQVLMAACGVPAVLGRLVRNSRLPDVFHAACLVVSHLSEKICLTRTGEGCLDFLLNLLMASDVAMEPDILESACVAMKAFAHSPYMRDELQRHPFVGPLLMYSEVFCEDEQLCCTIYQLLHMYLKDNPSIQQAVLNNADWTKSINACATGSASPAVRELAAKLLGLLHPKEMEPPQNSSAMQAATSAPSEEIVQQLQQMQQELSSAKISAAGLQEQLTVAQEQLAAAHEKLAAAQEQLAASQTVIQAQNKQMAITQEETQRAVLATYIEKISKLKNEKQELAEALTSAEKQNVELSERSAIMAAMRTARILRLLHLCHRQSMEMEVNTAICNGLQQEKKGLLGRISSLEEQLSALQQEVTTTKERDAEMASHGDQLVAQVRELKLQVKELQQRAELDNEKAQGLETALSAALGQCKEHEVALQQYQAMTGDDMQKQVAAQSELQGKCDALQSEVGLLQAEIVELQQQRITIQKLNDDCNAQQEALRTAIKDREGTVAHLEAMNVTLHAEVAAMKQELAMAQEREADLEQQQAAMEAAQQAQEEERAGQVTQLEMQLLATHEQLKEAKSAEKDIAQQLADAMIQMEEERRVMAEHREQWKAEAEHGRAHLVQEVARLKEELEASQVHVHNLVSKMTKAEEEMAQRVRRMHDRDLLLLSYETWGNRCQKDMLVQFDYREIAIRVGIRQEESTVRSSLMDWHLEQVQRITLTDLHRQEIQRLRQTTFERTQWSSDHLSYLQQVWQLAGLTWESATSTPSAGSNPETSAPSTPFGVNTWPTISPTTGIKEAPSLRLTIISPRVREAAVRHDGPLLGSLAGTQGETRDANAGTLHSSRTENVHLNPKDISVEAVCRDSATVRWVSPPVNHPRALYQVLLADNENPEYRIEANLAGSYHQLQNLKPNRIYCVSVRLLVEPAAAADRRQVIVKFRTTNALEPCDGPSCTISTQGVASADIRLARNMQSKGHPNGVCLDKQSLGPTGALLNWTAIPHHFPAQYCIWISNDAGLSFVACGMTGNNHFLLRDLVPGTTYHAAVTSGPSGILATKSGTIIFSTKAKGRDTALPPPKMHKSHGPLDLASEEPVSPVLAAGSKLRLSNLVFPSRTPTRQTGTNIMQISISQPIWAEKAWMYSSPTSNASPADPLNLSEKSTAGDRGSLRGSLMNLDISNTLSLIGDDVDLGASVAVRR